MTGRSRARARPARTVLGLKLLRAWRPPRIGGSLLEDGSAGQALLHAIRCATTAHSATPAAKLAGPADPRETPGVH